MCLLWDGSQVKERKGCLVGKHYLYLKRFLEDIPSTDTVNTAALGLGSKKLQLNGLVGLSRDALLGRRWVLSRVGGA